MNITFLIGNGFDIKLGLKTRYTDFYKIYIDSNKDNENESIKTFTDMIQPDYKTWADFEMAFAENAFGTKKDVRDILYDFSVKFANYLTEQTLLCDYTDKSISQKFKNFLLNGYTFLEKRDRETIKNTYDSYIGNRIINFINFNYTDTLENLINTCRTNTNSNELQTFRVKGSIYHTIIDKIINIHGHLGDSIIIGIDSIEQLKNNDLKKDTALSKYCVKSKINEDIGNIQVESNFVNTVMSSNIIYSYGLSFGASDKSRWEVITKWLKSDKNKKLIIYKYETNFRSYNSAYRRKLLDAIEELKNYYLKLLGFDESEYESYYDQIFVIDSDDVLDFKLIKEESLEVYTAS